MGRAKPRARIVIKCDPQLKEEWERFKYVKRMSGEQALRYLLDLWKRSELNVEIF